MLIRIGVAVAQGPPLEEQEFVEHQGRMGQHGPAAQRLKRVLNLLLVLGRAALGRALFCLQLGQLFQVLRPTGILRA